MRSEPLKKTILFCEYHTIEHNCELCLLYHLIFVTFCYYTRLCYNRLSFSLSLSLSFAICICYFIAHSPSLVCVTCHVWISESQSNRVAPKIISDNSSAESFSIHSNSNVRDFVLPPIICLTSSHRAYFEQLHYIYTTLASHTTRHTTPKKCCTIKFSVSKIHKWRIAYIPKTYTHLLAYVYNIQS